MKKSCFIAILATIGLFSCQNDEVQNNLPDDPIGRGFVAQPIEGQYIVVYKDKGALRLTTANGFVKQETVLQATHDIFREANLAIREPEFVYGDALRGITVKLSKEEAIQLQGNENVAGVYPDMIVTYGLPVALAKPTPSQPAEITPWGVARIGGFSDGTGKTAWIIDTGIDLDHPDLNVDQTRGKNFVLKSALPDDDNGHGTHCSGIIGAMDNNIGTVGVAAGATVVPIKVLNRKGSGTYSQIIAGIDYVAANAKTGDAVNMSFGGGVYDPIDQAILNLSAKGVKIAIAAGNEAQDANNCSPARVNGTNIYTVSAMAKGDLWASYSNFSNPPVDYCAPGSSIYSTYKNGSYATLSGTSMAAPHVCGILLLGSITSDGTVIGDPDGNPDPIAESATTALY
ncbi:MAG: peptidase s8 and s53 in kexin sedolisin [Proteiniphilum sp.]|jgi:subtilisin family serine protease|nr:peptidase s8 and s53 in kexin sedolisin [Proteiniphilum sp.]